MKLYQVPDVSPYQGKVRVLYCLAIIIMSVVCFISLSSWFDLTGRTQNMIGEVGAATVLVGVAGAITLATKDNSWIKLKRGLQYEISEEKIVQKRDGKTTAEIPFRDISSVAYLMGWLIVRGDAPSQKIAIPKETLGFEEIRRDLSSRLQIVSAPPSTTLQSFLPMAVMLTAFATLVLVQDTRIILASGSVFLLFLAWGIYSTMTLWRRAKRPKLVLTTYLITMLIAVWIIVVRAKFVP